MKKSQIYTKTGDDGTTGLVSGNRVSKSDHRISLYGEVDELNSRTGLVASMLTMKFAEESAFLRRIQSALFDLGSNMACEEVNRSKFSLPQLDGHLIVELESHIDKMDQTLPSLKNFILPGGTEISAHIHLARTEARHVERKMTHFHQKTSEELPTNSLMFMNRLSDYYFVLARFVDHKSGVGEIFWTGRS